MVLCSHHPADSPHPPHCPTLTASFYPLLCKSFTVPIFLLLFTKPFLKNLAQWGLFILVRAMIFPVVMYGCESWTIKKVECRRIDAFEVWCWRRLLRVPWTARRSNQSILKEISPEYSLEGLMLKLKLQYFGRLMQRTYSFEKTLMLGKIEVGGEGEERGWDGWMTAPTQWAWVWVNSNSWWWTGRPGMLQSMGQQRVGQDWVTELIDWGWVSFMCYLCPFIHFQFMSSIPFHQFHF